MVRRSCATCSSTAFTSDYSLFTVGDRGRLIGDAARAAGLEQVQHFASKEDAARALKDALGPGDVLLVKASHGLALGAVVAELAASDDDPPATPGATAERD